jgi:pyruvate,water dikinase
VILFKMIRAETRRQGLAQTFAQQFRTEIIPDFVQETEIGAKEDLSALEPAVLVQRLEHWRRRTLDTFARDSLKPTALAAFAMGRLEQALGRYLGPEKAQEALRDLVMGVHPDAEADLPGASRDLSESKLDHPEFLRRFGHRGSQEMELSQPRWSEDPAALQRLFTGPAKGGAPAPPPSLDAVWERLAAEGKISAAALAPLRKEQETVHTYLGLRETAKHYLMRGYALIRRVLVELDRRFRLNGGIFYLLPEELPRLLAGEDLSTAIEMRRKRRALALSLDAPPVLFSDDLEALGRPPQLAALATWKGVPLSAGVAEAPALVLEQPLTTEPPAEPYILVCPSTDPAWVPLFVHARGLVMETGGVLSHGAIVAREFGLPAVAGLAGVQKQLRTGQRLRVDGHHGTVTVLGG